MLICSYFTIRFMKVHYKMHTGYYQHIYFTEFFFRASIPDSIPKVQNIQEENSDELNPCHDSIVYSIYI